MKLSVVIKLMYTVYAGICIMCFCTCAMPVYAHSIYMCIMYVCISVCVCVVCVCHVVYEQKEC